MDYLWLALPVVFLIAGGALWFAASRPGFWIAVVKSLAADMLPSFKKLFRPSKLTPAERFNLEQKRRWHRGGGKNG